MKRLTKKFRIVKVRSKKPWQVQQRHKLFFWKDLGMHYSTFEEAKEEALKFKFNHKSK